MNMIKYKKNQNDIFLVLNKGDNLISEIEKVAIEHNINGATITGIGAVNNVEIGYYHLDKKEYSRKMISQDMELLGLNGNITLVDNKPFVHIHAILSDENFHCKGGHLFQAQVAVTCEIHIRVLNLSLSRQMNDLIGLRLINCGL